MWALNAGEPQAPAAPEPGGAKFERLFTQLDKFCDYIESIPQLAQHPEIRQRVAALRAGKGQLKMARSDVLYHQKVHQAQTAQLLQKHKEEQAAMLQKKEAMDQPAPPLDGNALGQALAKDLGLVGPTPAPGKAASPRPNGVAKPTDDGKARETTKVNFGDREIQQYLKRNGLWK
jgi:hypothetical protein